MIILNAFLVNVLTEILNYVINSLSDDSTGENLQASVQNALITHWVAQFIEHRLLAC